MESYYLSHKKSSNILKRLKNVHDMHEAHEKYNA